jgi:hypothetical protein
MTRIEQLESKLDRLASRFEQRPPPRGSGILLRYQQLRDEYHALTTGLKEDQEVRRKMVGKLFAYEGYPYSRRLAKGKVYCVTDIAWVSGRLVCARWSHIEQMAQKTTITIHKDDLIPWEEIA